MVTPLRGHLNTKLHLKLHLNDLEQGLTGQGLDQPFREGAWGLWGDLRDELYSESWGLQHPKTAWEASEGQTCL